MTELSRSDLVVEIKRLNNELLSAKALIKTLRNRSKVDDNVSGEQVISDDDLVSKIGDMAVDLASHFSEGWNDWWKIKESEFYNKSFEQPLKELFKSHRNTVSGHDNSSQV